ncbi:hypothetical protein L195_g039261 [Trifolium pratense]|uniref:Uncharacterized protein n=1 Tax=Trifolium pratense TaxID=57577 RepID=A0A2K3LXG8_TRIPR|nr:hypothetical protein L195_g039261 [Trifolium pratense]
MTSVTSVRTNVKWNSESRIFHPQRVRWENVTLPKGLGGDCVRAWTDKWLFPGKSIIDIGITVPADMQFLMVKDLVDINGGWKFDMLETWLHVNIISKMHALLPPYNDSDNDDRRPGAALLMGNFQLLQPTICYAGSVMTIGK